MALINFKYINDNLIHSIFDLARIRFDQQNLTKSIFSYDYISKKRLIRKNKLNYDSIFSK